MKHFLDSATRFLFFTGKGGVGKTSLSCATSIALADTGKRVLLVSTDPASNLDEVLGTSLSNEPRPVVGVNGLDAMNIDPMEAARMYRERIVAPIRGLLPEATVKSVEEQLSGACTTEIASFNEFSRMLGDESAVEAYDHIILDTAPTGHTLRLLELPAAWNDFIAENKTGSTCLGPLSGMADQKVIYEKALAELRNESATTIILVARSDEASLKEADRASSELHSLGIERQVLLLNAVFKASLSDDPVAREMERRANLALANLPERLKNLRCYKSLFRCNGLSGIESLRQAFSESDDFEPVVEPNASRPDLPDMAGLLTELARPGKGVIMTMGKGGVGKTSLAKQIAQELAQMGHRVHLTTTDPANHVSDIEIVDTPNLTVSAIDPKEVTRLHVEQTLATAGAKLDKQARALLEEELRSPCTEEIAVFTAFAHEVAKGEDCFVVLDTAPTGHTLLLLDATEAYHREVLKNTDSLPAKVQRLLPRLRDAEYTRTIIVALPEATPVHEAAQLQEDLRRAKIEPFAWVLNQCLSITDTRDPLLLAKAEREKPYLREVSETHAKRWVAMPWGGEAFRYRKEKISL